MPPPEFGTWPLKGMKDIALKMKECEAFLRASLPKSTMEDALRAKLREEDFTHAML